MFQFYETNEKYDKWNKLGIIDSNFNIYHNLYSNNIHFKFILILAMDTKKKC